MRSKNLSCKLSWPLIRKDLTRFWPVWASYLVIWLLILPTPLITDQYHSTVSIDQVIVDIHRQIVYAGGESALVLTAIYGCVAAFAVWSYLYQSRSASLFHALPVTRETLFCSHFTAGLSFLVIPNVFIAAVTYVCQAGLGYFDPTQILCWLAVVCLESLLFYSLGTLAAMCTGSLPAMPVLYGLINFAVVVCESLMMEFSSQLYWGVSSQPLKLTFLSPAVHLAQASVYVYDNYPIMGSDGFYYSTESIRYYNPEYLTLLCVYALAAVALIVCSLLLYRRRATESAGDVIAFDFLKPIAKYGFAFGCALVLGWLLDEVLFPSGTTVVTRIFCCCVGGAVGYITAAMLLKKSFRVFQPRKLAGLLALWVALAGIFVAIDNDAFGVESRVPRLGELTKVTVYSDYDLELTLPQDMDQMLAIHRSILERKEELENYNRSHSIPYEDSLYCYVRINYYLEDGSTLRRSYDLNYLPEDLLDDSHPAAKLSRLMSDPQRLVDYYLPPEDATMVSMQLNIHDDTMEQLTGDTFTGRYGSAYINDDHFDLLLAALEDDIRAGRLAQWNRTNTAKTSRNIFSLEMNYNVPINPQEESIFTIDSKTAAVREGSLWSNLSVYNFERPSRTLSLLVELGYLTDIPSVFEGEVVYE
ncbi:MAG: ABC transporter permease [Clostridia bacterium]|nr:ABC transporter permease [Clostridia bacterium]